MRGLTAKADGGLLTHRVLVVQGAHSSAKLEGAYRNLMKAFVAASDSVSFDTARFALFLSQTDTRVRRWFLTLAIHVITIQAERGDLGLAREEEDILLSQDCKTILERGVNTLT